MTSPSRLPYIVGRTGTKDSRECTSITHSRLNILRQAVEIPTRHENHLKTASRE